MYMSCTWKNEAAEVFLQQSRLALTTRAFHIELGRHKPYLDARWRRELSVQN